MRLHWFRPGILQYCFYFFLAFRRSAMIKECILLRCFLCSDQYQNSSREYALSCMDFQQHFCCNFIQNFRQLRFEVRLDVDCLAFYLKLCWLLIGRLEHWAIWIGWGFFFFFPRCLHSLVFSDICSKIFPATFHGFLIFIVAFCTLKLHFGHCFYGKVFRFPTILSRQI